MQRAEMEELRQRDANMTALQAIGPRKKLKLDGDGASSGLVSTRFNYLPLVITQIILTLSNVLNTYLL